MRHEEPHEPWGACHLGVGSTTEEIVEVADGAALNEIGRRQLHSELSLDSIAQGDQAQRVDTQHARHIRFGRQLVRRDPIVLRQKADQRFHSSSSVP